jgi:hypothetical protein
MSWVKRIATAALVSNHVYRILLTGFLIAALLKKTFTRRG